MCFGYCLIIKSPISLMWYINPFQYVNSKEWSRFFMNLIFLPNYWKKSKYKRILVDTVEKHEKINLFCLKYFYKFSSLIIFEIIVHCTNYVHLYFRHSMSQTIKGTPTKPRFVYKDTGFRKRDIKSPLLGAKKQHYFPLLQSVIYTSGEM